MEKVVTVAVGSYEGGLMVYMIDLDNEIHLRSFSSKDAVVRKGLMLGLIEIFAIQRKDTIHRRA